MAAVAGQVVTWQDKAGRYHARRFPWSVGPVGKADADAVAFAKAKVSQGIRRVHVTTYRVPGRPGSQRRKAGA